tara:strand:- start:27 stop:626 length:600 start_codon:yes stop_codon:yes gene_type:complete
MANDSKCSQQKLDYFKWKHLTYINQIFGDAGIREIISEVYPNKCLEFRVEKVTEGSGFEEGTDHHVLFDKIKKKRICSVDTLKIQNTNINKNDTLCQSYTLLVYFNRKIYKTNKARQMEIIQMYRDILANRTLLLKIQNEIVNNKRNAGLWKDYTEDTDGKNPLEMNMANIVRHIRDTLKRWENYGYQYFIREGKCKKD